MSVGIKILLAGVLALIGSAAGASEVKQLVIGCSGTFHDQGLATRERTLYRIDTDGVQIWDAGNRQWLFYSCVGRCWTSRGHVSVNDRYASAERGLVFHFFDLNRSTGALDEEWRVGDDLLQLVSQCELASDPAPTLAGLEPSTRYGDRSIHALSYGLPLPIPRRIYETRLRQEHSLP